MVVVIALRGGIMNMDCRRDIRPMVPAGPAKQPGRTKRALKRQRKAHHEKNGAAQHIHRILAETTHGGPDPAMADDSVATQSTPARFHRSYLTQRHVT